VPSLPVGPAPSAGAPRIVSSMLAPNADDGLNGRTPPKPAGCRASESAMDGAEPVVALIALVESAEKIGSAKLDDVDAVLSGASGAAPSVNENATLAIVLDVPAGCGCRRRAERRQARGGGRGRGERARHQRRRARRRGHLQCLAEEHGADAERLLWLDGRLRRASRDARAERVRARRLRRGRVEYQLAQERERLLFRNLGAGECAVPDVYMHELIVSVSAGDNTAVCPARSKWFGAAARFFSPR
jgi:hypothetical protein